MYRTSSIIPRMEPWGKAWRGPSAVSANYFDHCEPLITLWANHYIVSHSLHCEPLTTLWATHYIVSHSLHCEPLTTLWATHFIVSHSLHCEPLTTLWATHYIVSHSLHCEPLTTLWATHYKYCNSLLVTRGSHQSLSEALGTRGTQLNAHWVGSRGSFQILSSTKVQ